MHRILIYGDSNVWGDNFLTGERIPYEKQWVNILRQKLGNEYCFYQEGLPGRLAGREEKEKKYKNGRDSFISCFRTNAPVDIIIIALGTNDLQMKYHKTASKIINDLLWYQKVIQKSYQDLDDRKKYFAKGMPKFIYLLPPNFDYLNNANMIFDGESEQKRQEIISFFTKKNIECVILNDMSLFDDGIHLDYAGHEAVAKLIEGVVIKNAN